MQYDFKLLVYFMMIIPNYTYSFQMNLLHILSCHYQENKQNKPTEFINFFLFAHNLYLKY